MSVHNLNRLQSAIYFELKKHGSATGYDLTKEINARGIYYSHQQVYRELHRIPSTCVLVPQDGKPDRKVYSLLSDVTYEHQDNLDIEFLLAYPATHLVEKKIESILEILHSPAEMPVPQVESFRIDQLSLQLDHLKKAIKA